MTEQEREYMERYIYAVSYTHLDVYKRQLSTFPYEEMIPFIQRNVNARRDFFPTKFTRSRNLRCGGMPPA